MNKLLLTTLLLLAVSIGARAQFYKNSIGVRTGHTSAITYKVFVNDVQALELMASGRNDGFQLNTIYQFNKPMNLSFNDRFFAYYGVGGGIGYEKFDNLTDDPIAPNSGTVRNHRTYFTMDVTTILGVEYRWLAAPITIGVDIKPYFQFIGMRFSNTQFWDTGISVKYVF